MNYLLVALVVLVAALSAAEPPPSRARARPTEWAAPIIETSLDNCYRVSAELFRCEQPGTREIGDLHALGVRSLLNLRHYHTDSAEFAKAGLKLLAEPMSAGNVTVDQLVAALKKFHDAPKPVLVHCWHGSDRTGVFVAAYRLVVQGWKREAAIDEFRHGGYGYHESSFPNLLKLLENLDVEAVRARLRE